MRVGQRRRITAQTCKADFCFFVANYKHKAYELKRNVISHQEYVANFALHDYPIRRCWPGTASWPAASTTRASGASPAARRRSRVSPA